MQDALSPLRSACGDERHSIRNVLAATDFSSGGRVAAERAAVQATQIGADLALVHVVEKDRMALLRGVLTPGPDLHPRMVEQAELQLQAEAAGLARLRTLQPLGVIRQGRAVQELCKAATSCDLLVIGASSSHRVRDFSLGKTAFLARLSPRPLLVVRRAAQSAYQRVLVPVDFSQNSRAALFTAMALAPNCAFELLHVVDFPFEGRMRMAGASDADLARYREQGLSQALEKLRELESEVRGRGHIAAAQLRSGDVRFELPRVVREQGIDLVAMGKQGQSALGDMFLGSACSWALEHAGCDVLVVPPGTLAAQP